MMRAIHWRGALNIRGWLLLTLGLWPTALLTSRSAHAASLEIIVMTSQKPDNMAGNTARPGHFAELEELEAARKAGSLAAYDLFLARHPNSRYAPGARKERAALAAK